MTKAARSVFWFGIYLVALGVTLVVVPNVPLSLFGMPPPDEPWIRVAGMLALLLGYYYVQCARAELRPFFALTIPARGAVIVFFAAFVALGFAKPTLLLFGRAQGRTGAAGLAARRTPSTITSAPTI